MTYIIQSVNPTTEKIIQSFNISTNEDIKSCLNLSKLSFEKWNKTTFKQRSILISKLSLLINIKKKKLANLMAIEMGKPLRQGEDEILKCIAICQYYAKYGNFFLKNTLINTNSPLSFTQHEPMGPLLAIMPWNFPFWQVFRMCIPAIIGGNVIILKHAPNVTLCALEIKKIFNEANFLNLNGIFQILLLSNIQTNNLIENKIIKGVSFTGSSSVGTHISTLCAKHFKKCILELGGNDPFIVFKDANIKKAAKLGVFARCLNSGQSCIAAKRFYIHQDIYKSFYKNFIKYMQLEIVGNPLNISSTIGPLCSNKQLLSLSKQIDDAKNKGATILYTGKNISNTGFYCPPTIITNVTKEMNIFYEEIFAPVAIITTFKNKEEVIALANNSNYGLGASIWTKKLKKITYLTSQIESGIFYINTFTRSDIKLSFGGLKNSGIGKELGKDGIKEFMNSKSISINF